MSVQKVLKEMNCSGAKILIIDDNPGDLDFLVALLEDFDIRTVLDGESALEAVQEEVPDLILLDINMPRMNGFEVCKRLKEQEISNSIPIIFLSARSDVENIVKGFEVGGVDYITKPYLPKEALARIKTHLRLCKAIHTLDNFANIDELTGIANRRNFFAQAHTYLQEAQENEEMLHLFILDLDNFKSINDTYGHAAGDTVIKDFVKIVNTNISNIKIFARLGGDEFVLILGNISIDAARQQLEQMRLLVEKSHFKPQNNANYTVSIGMATQMRHELNLDALLLRADINLYKAKQKKNRLY